jgi:hypothetical protein
MACTWALVREESDRMELTLPMADWIWVWVTPRSLEVARAPWQLAQ